MRDTITLTKYPLHMFDLRTFNETKASLAEHTKTMIVYVPC